jgi:hypothetical protein
MNCKGTKHQIIAEKPILKKFFSKNSIEHTLVAGNAHGLYILIFMQKIFKIFVFELIIDKYFHQRR